MEIDSTLGPYRILEQIGVGGMATVYKAYQPDVDRLVAIKVLPDHYAREAKFVSRFQQEARVIAKLEHHNIVPVYDFGEQNGVTYLVMRYLQAGTLKDILARGALSLTDATKIIADVAAALDHAHAQGIIHRDVKPSNILVDKQGNAYLTDFGIAKVLESTHEFTGSAVLGTPAYMAPEQTLGKGVAPQSDVYSLGVMLYEMVTGKQPFEADTPMAIALMHVHEPLPLPRKVKPDLPEAVELVILKALSKDPKERFQSAGELAQSLAVVVGGNAPGHLADRASVAASGKSSDEVTFDLRQELQRRERAAATRQWFSRLPLLGGGLLMIGLVGVLAWLGAQFFVGQESIRVTATALEVGYQAATLTVAAYTNTPVPTATLDQNQQMTLTAGVTQTQLALETLTQAVVVTDAQHTQSAEETQLALTPAATATITPQASATNIPTTYFHFWTAGNNYTKELRAGRVVIGINLCWATEAEAQANVQLDPTLTINGAPTPLTEFNDRTIWHKYEENITDLWCLKWDSEAYFVVTLEAGTYDIQFQWGNTSGFGTLSVVNP